MQGPDLGKNISGSLQVPPSSTCSGLRGSITQLSLGNPRSAHGSIRILSEPDDLRGLIEKE